MNNIEILIKQIQELTKDELRTLRRELLKSGLDDEALMIADYEQSDHKQDDFIADVKQQECNDEVCESCQ